MKHFSKKWTVPFEECPIFPYKEDNKIYLQWKPGQKNFYGVLMTTLTAAWTCFPGSGSSTPCNPTGLKFGGRLNDGFFSRKVSLARAFQEWFPILFLGFLRTPELWFSVFLNSQAPGVWTGRHSALTRQGCCCELSVFKGSAFLVLLLNFLSQRLGWGGGNETHN